jgi:hypothetical protein
MSVSAGARARVMLRRNLGVALSAAFLYLLSDTEKR